jgi:hypothetical protein
MEVNAAMYCGAPEIHVVVSSTYVSHAGGTQFKSQVTRMAALTEALRF